MHSFGNSRRLSFSAVRDSGSVSEIGARLAIIARDPAPTMSRAHHFIYCGGNGPCRPGKRRMAKSCASSALPPGALPPRRSGATVCAVPPRETAPEDWRPSLPIAHVAQPSNETRSRTLGGLPFGGPVWTEKEIETPSCSNLNTSPKQKAPREAGPVTLSQGHRAERQASHSDAIAGFQPRR
jgi:hypothetical protein